jgi:hypothetical protein
MVAPKKGFLAFEAKAVSLSICTNPSPEKYNGEFGHLGTQGSWAAALKVPICSGRTLVLSEEPTSALLLSNASEHVFGGSDMSILEMQGMRIIICLT